MVIQNKKHSMDFSLVIFPLLFLLSFFSGIIDLSFGMGYGFAVTPIMLLLGFSANLTVPIVLFTSAIGGLASSFFNRHYKNVDFSSRSRATKIALFMGIFGAIGATIGVGISFNLSQFIRDLYIGFIVILSGILALISYRLSSTFSWIKILFITLFGSLNKGLTGSGLGPIITTGTMLTGIDEKSAVSIQALSESLISFIGFLVYFALEKPIDYPALTVMSLGAILASPFAASIMKRLDKKTMRSIIGVYAIVIGLSIIWKAFTT